MLKLMYITADPALARAIVTAGVDRVFVDLETRGKLERQGHLDTVISDHSFADARAVRAAVPDAELLVRINPPYSDTPTEVENAIAAGADLIMLPMFRSAAEVASVLDVADGRAGVIPLLETPQAIDELDAISRLEGIAELYVGLNDLHLALGCPFIFDPLADGYVDRVAQAARRCGLGFGFGGIARLDEGDIPGAMILAEHCKLGSSSVILSRTFYRDTGGAVDSAETVFRQEISRLRDLERRLRQRLPAEIEADHQRLLSKIREVSLRRSRSGQAGV